MSAGDGPSRHSRAQTRESTTADERNAEVAAPGAPTLRRQDTTALCPQRHIYDIHPLPSRPLASYTIPNVPTPAPGPGHRASGPDPEEQWRSMAQSRRNVVSQTRAATRGASTRFPREKCYKMRLNETVWTSCLPSLTRKPLQSTSGRPAPFRSIPAIPRLISGRYRGAGRSRERQRAPLRRLTPERGCRARAVPVPARPRADRSSGTR